MPLRSPGVPTGGIFRHEAHQTNAAWIRESESLRGHRLQPQDSATLGMAQSCTTDVNPSFAIDMPCGTCRSLVSGPVSLYTESRGTNMIFETSSRYADSAPIRTSPTPHKSSGSRPNKGHISLTQTEAAGRGRGMQTSPRHCQSSGLLRPLPSLSPRVLASPVPITSRS